MSDYKCSGAKKKFLFTNMYKSLLLVPEWPFIPTTPEGGERSGLCLTGCLCACCGQCVQYLFYSSAGFITLPINNTEPEGKEKKKEIVCLS